jgi:hypothetical protein
MAEKDGLLRRTSTHAPQQAAPLLDHLVDATEIGHSGYVSTKIAKVGSFAAVFQRERDGNRIVNIRAIIFAHHAASR